MNRSSFIGRLEIGNKTYLTIVYLSLIIVFILTFYPLYYVFVYSINDPSAVAPGLMLIPRRVSFDAYRSIFANPAMIRAFFISASRAVLGSVLSLIVMSLIAFPLSIRALPGRRFFNFYFIITMYISAGLIPYFLLINNLGLTDSFWVYIIPGLVNVFFMILIRTYMEGLPDSLRESAQIDGAGYFRIFVSIIMPLSLPVMAAVALFTAVNQWNAFSDTLLFNIRSEHLYTLQFVLSRMVQGLRIQDPAQADAVAQQLHAAGVQIVTPRTLRLAATMFTIVPITLVYPFLQRFFVKGLMIGSIKG